MTEFLNRWRTSKPTASFESLLAPHVDHLYRLAYRFTGNSHAAEDLVQDVLVKLYRMQGEIERLEKPRPWLARVLYHEYVDRWRREDTITAEHTDALLARARTSREQMLANPKGTAQ